MEGEGFGQKNSSLQTPKTDMLTTESDDVKDKTIFEQYILYTYNRREIRMSKLDECMKEEKVG